MIMKPTATRDRPLLIFIISILLILSSCSGWNPSPLERADPEEYDDEYSDQDQIASQPIGKCPEEKTYYQLWFSHQVVLDTAAPDGSNLIHITWENREDSFFVFTVFPDGTIRNEDPESKVDIYYHGRAEHPDSDDCALQVFNGAWPLKAEITGTCQDDLMKIHIREEWVKPVLESNCGTMPAMGLDWFSAPELDLEFDLTEGLAMDGIELGANPSYYGQYYYSINEDPALYLVPLVPPSE